MHTSNDTTLSLTTDMLEEMIDVCLEDSDFSDDFLTPPKRKRRHDRSLENSSGKKQMVKYNRARAKQAVLDDYLGPIPIFKDRQFERVFRIAKSKAEWIIGNLAKYDPFWTQTYDAIGRPSIAPEVKFLAAQKKLCYGVSFSAFQDYFQMGDSTARLCVSKLTRGIVNCPEIADVYLRNMTRSDAKKTTELHQDKHEIDGMLGSLDVMKVHWGNCPIAWKGQFKGKEGVPTIGLEAFCDYNLWIWHDCFGFPGALNDINIWERSTLFESFQDGSFSELDFEYLLNGELFDQLFLLVDGIYPALSRFVKTISVPITKIDRNFTGWQEGSRKDIERAFGVLQKKFHFLVHSIQMHEREDIFYAVRSCVAMHNMMVEVRVDEDNQESSSFYEMVSDAIQDGTVDSVERDVLEEDANIAARMDAGDGDLNNDLVDLELRKKSDRSRFYSQRFKTV